MRTLTPLLGAAFRNALVLRRLFLSYAAGPPVGGSTAELAATEEAAEEVAARPDAPALAPVR